MKVSGSSGSYLQLGPKLPPTALGRGRLGLLPQSCWFGGTSSPTHLGSLGGRLRSSLVAVLGARFQVLDAVLTLSAVLTAVAGVCAFPALTRMGWLDHEVLTLSLSLACPLITITSYVAPTGMVLEAVRRMKASHLPMVVFKAQAACNILSIGYGLQIANAAVLMTNLFGLACQILFFAGEHYIRAADAQWLPFAVKTSVILNGGIVIARSAPMNLLGQFITVFNIFLYSCPLMNLGAVLRTRNSSPFPSFMVGINVVNNALWSIYALLIEDVVVLMPSILGYACSFFQVLLILWCRNRLPFDLSFLLAIIQKAKPRASEAEPSTPESDHLAEASEEQDGNEDW
eukprot:CAMPEP_0181467900 /NCGR_PEP_ID=MMETSP1110-20121109/37219_1 /TAXON_ID=174948 /ORGANISM="Symbiodinium sp., Strain CCMP421" /LENGTH=343 /DNA_ID=CAMNT_0023592745 /DNA_START=28 /DNA_END=1056 /DNA_ORIENTATION=-